MVNSNDQGNSQKTFFLKGGGGVTLEKIKYAILCIHGNKREMLLIYNVTNFCFLYFSIEFIKLCFKIRGCSYEPATGLENYLVI